MRSIISFCLSVLLVISIHAQAQLTVAEALGVYGGRVNAITGISIHNDSSRIFISTESANSVFWADVYSGASPSFGNFTVIPGLDANAGYGSGINQIAAHEASGKLFFNYMGIGINSIEPTGSSAVNVVLGNPQTFLIHDDYLFYLEGNDFHFGTLDIAGSYTADLDSPITIGSIMSMTTIFVSPADSAMYVFAEGNSPTLLKLSDKYNAINATTTYTDISPSTLSSSVEWLAFGVAFDGRLCIAGATATTKWFAWSDDEIIWTEYATGMNGVGGPNIAFSGNASSYYVYYSNGYNDNMGTSSTDWYGFGQIGGEETHPNDGYVYADPNNDLIVYMTTDMGLGASIDNGAAIFEINEGVEAVQVEDIDMDDTKNVAWVASKSGIRKVSNYQSTPSWSTPMYPLNDGSPYYSSAMNPQDTNTAYAGNLRIYKTEDGGVNWNQMFTPEDPPYNFSSIGTNATAIEVFKGDTNIVFAGFSQWNTDKGGLFYSIDAGLNWNQILLEASSVGQDIDVQDIVFNIEAMDTVAYVGVEYDLSAPQGRSIYKLTKSGTSWNAAQDMNAGGTSTGSLIVATIRDLDVSVTGDTVFACGTDAGINHPIAYYKPISSTNVWTPFPTSGFPFIAGKQGRAITIGVDTVYCAVDNEIYVYPVGATDWSMGYSYPLGMEINVLYWDELFVGTGTGLYGHMGGGHIGISEPVVSDVDHIKLFPNPTDGVLFLEMTMKKPAQVEIRISDILGKSLFCATKKLPRGDQRLQFDTSIFKKGVYFIQVKYGSKKYTTKLVVG
ncbi:MAG: T9SS type A sorting domain-containing protein [Bacteroidales bacterium]|nr:T9SS type A sorting domain-containing protein [Bacteroidales bacterium]